ncbi:uncharacterized protein LOC120337620 isoform X3 [Styela clava]
MEPSRRLVDYSSVLMTLQNMLKSMLGMEIAPSEDTNTAGSLSSTITKVCFPRWSEFLIKARCYRSQRKNEPPHSLFVTLRQNNVVQWEKQFAVIL